MEPQSTTPYQIIGVSPYADEATIAAAFRTRMAEVHPDRATSEDDRARRTAAAATVSAAYRVLRDPEARADLDLELAAADSWGWRIGRLRAAIGRRRAPSIKRPSVRVPEVRIPEMRIPEMRVPEVELPFDADDLRAASARGGSLLRTIGGFLFDTRLGQWLVLVLLWAVPALADALTGRGLPSQVVLLLIAGTAALMGRRGAPSPAHDAAAILLPMADRLGRALLRTGARVAVGASVGAVRAARESKAWREQMAEQVQREMAEADRRERGDRPSRREERAPRDDRDGRYIPREERAPRDDRDGRYIPREERAPRGDRDGRYIPREERGRGGDRDDRPARVPRDDDDGPARGGRAEDRRRGRDDRDDRPPTVFSRRG